VSRFFDRIWRPEQLPAALLAAMRVLTDPAQTGAVTLDLPAGRYRMRIWHPNLAAVTQAPQELTVAEKPASIPVIVELDPGRETVAAWP